MRFTPVLFLFARLAVAQTLPPRTPVTVYMLTLPTIEGRLVASDSQSLTIIRDDSEIVIPRDRISRILASRPTTQEFSVPMAIGGGLAGAALGALVVGGLCDTGSCSGSYAPAMLYLGGGGMLVGALAGTVVGALVRTDHRVPNSIRVDGWPEGPDASEVCGLPTVQGTTGAVSYRLSATLYCRPRFSLGAELGRISDDKAFSYTSSFGSRAPGSADTTFSVSRQDGRRMDFQGAFVEFNLGGRLNPRVLTSLGYYRQQVTLGTDTSFYDGSHSWFRDGRSGTTHGAIGAGLGLALSMPLWQHISLGAEERTHCMTVGDHRMQNTFGVTLRIRP